MRADPVLERGPKTAIRDPAPIYHDGVLCCFHGVGDVFAIGPGHFATSGVVWMAINLRLRASPLRRSS
jgi:hypothetical protein